MSEGSENPLEAFFWRKRSLSELSPVEWEALCDGCGRCCLHKFEDEESGRFFLTRVSCRFLDLSSCHCTKYAVRRQVEPDCVTMTPSVAQNLTWIPETCAYRLLARGEDLPRWHPLLSGDPSSVGRAGISVGNFAVSEEDVSSDALADEVIDCID